MNKTDSNTTATDEVIATIKTALVNEPEPEPLSSFDPNRECNKPGAGNGTAISNNNCDGHVFANFEPFVHQHFSRAMTFIPLNQLSVASVVELNSNAKPFDDDADALVSNLNIARVSSQQMCSSNISWLISNDSSGKGAELNSATMDDLEIDAISKPQAVTNTNFIYSQLMTSLQRHNYTGNVNVNDNCNGMHLGPEIGAVVTVKDESRDCVDSDEVIAISCYKPYPEIIDLTSDQEHMADITISNDGRKDREPPIVVQQQKICNKRAAGNVKATRRKLVRKSAKMVQYSKCDCCDEHAHTNEKPYECPICAKRYIRKGHMVRHMKNHENLFYCSKCHKRHSEANGCKSHGNHCNFKRFECYLCKKSFVDGQKMAKHIRIHEGTRRRLRRSTRPKRFRLKLHDLFLEADK